MDLAKQLKTVAAPSEESWHRALHPVEFEKLQSKEMIDIEIKDSKNMLSLP